MDPWASRRKRGVEAGGPPAPERSWRSPSLHGVWEPVGWTPHLLDAAPQPSVEQNSLLRPHPARALSVCPSAPGCPSMLAMDPVLAVDSLVSPQQGPGLGEPGHTGPRESCSREGAIPDSRPLARWSAGGLTIQSSRRRLSPRPEWEHPQHRVPARPQWGPSPGQPGVSL